MRVAPASPPNKRWFRRFLRCVLWFGLGWSFVPAASAATNVTELIAQLDADDFAERESADAALRRLGRQAFPELERALRNEAPETRLRARSIRSGILDAEIRAGFTELGKERDDRAIDLERGMWLIARLVDPELEKAPIDREFDRLAKVLRAELRRRGVTEKTNPKTIPAKTIVAAIQTALFKQEGFSGTTDEDYIHPDNSAIDRVLKKNSGLPILLSHVVVSTCDRLDLPVYGIQVPGRYMVKVIGPKEELIVNPFEDAKVETAAGLRQTRFADPERHLVPSPHRDTLTRMMRNLISHFGAVDEGKNAAKAADMLMLLEGG